MNAPHVPCRFLGRVLLLFSFFFIPSITAACIDPSNPFPPPFLQARDETLSKLFLDLEHDLNDAARENQWNTSTTSFAVEITSAESTLWSTYHTAPQRVSGHVTGDTYFRIASVTKIFTVLAILLQQKDGKLSLQDPITKYIPELTQGGNKGNIEWGTISLESLASQLSGIPREYSFNDLFNNFTHAPSRIKDPTSIGLPPLNITDPAIPTCGMNRFTGRPCTSNDIINGIKKRHPLYAPNFRSSYSNVAFVLLGFVLERVTGNTYETVIKATIFEPLGMHNSSLETPPTLSGIIPLGDHGWFFEIGAYEATGGIYSTSSDMTIFLRSILNHQLLDVSITNYWFQPHSWSSNLHAAYGMPWEMFRTTSLLNDTDRGMTILTKSGGLPGYSSRIIMVPEYDIGITVLVAGDSGALEWLAEETLTKVVPVIEGIARVQTQENYSGTYSASPPTGLNSSITLTVSGGQGLVVTFWVMNATSVLHHFASFVTGLPPSANVRVQLTPTFTNRGENGEVWRIQYVPRGSGKEGIINGCQINDVDPLMYGGMSISEVVLIKDQDGAIISAELPAFRIDLQREMDDVADGALQRLPSTSLTVQKIFDQFTEQEL